MVILDYFKDTSQCQHLRNGRSTRAKAILVISQIWIYFWRIRFNGTLFIRLATIDE